MSDILDIVTKLSFELQSQGLDAAAQKLGEQIKLLSTLKSEEKALNKEKTDASKQDQKNQDAIRDAILKNSAAQKILTTSIKETVTQNTKLIDAIKKETGYIGQLEAKITALKITRRQADQQAIAGINEQIKALEKQRASALGQGATGGFLGGLLPQGDIGRQLSQGILFGLGIGGGFGVVTRLVSGAIDLFKDYGAELVNTVDYQEKLIASADALSGALKNEAQALSELLKTFASIDEGDTSTLAIQRQLELTKALGVVNLEQYHHEKEVHEGEQKLRQSNLSDLKKEKQAYQDLSDITKQLFQQAQEGKIGGKLPFSVNLDGLKTDAQKIDAIYKRAQEVYDIPQNILDKARLSVEKNIGFFKGATLDKALKKTLDDFSIENLKFVEEEKNKNTEIEASDKEFASKRQHAVDQLNEQLRIKTRSEHAQIVEGEIKLNEQLFHIDEKSIIDRNEVFRNEELNKITDERNAKRRELAEKGQQIDAQTEAHYNTLRSEVQRRFENKTAEELIAFHEKQYEIRKTAAKTQAEDDVKNLKEQLAIELQINEDTLATRRELSQKQYLQETIAEQDRYSKLKRDLIAYSLDSVNIEKQHQENLNLLQSNYERQGLNDLEKYYYDKIKIIKTYEQRTEDAVNAGRGSVYARERRILQERIISSKKELQQANDNATSLAGDPNRTAEDLNEAKNKIDKSKIQLRKDKIELLNFDVDYAQHIVKSFAEINQAVASSLNSIYELQTRKLDYLIERQTEKVEAARVLLDRGQTEVYEKEVKRLDDLQRQREINAKKQLEINSLLIASNAAVSVAEAIGAVIKIAAGGDPYTAAARVAAAAAAVIAAVVGIKAAFSESGYAEGEVDINGRGTSTSDSIPARLSKGESVINARATAKNKEVLQMINKGYDIQSMIPHFAVANKMQGNSIAGMSDKQVDKIVEAVNKKRTTLGVNFDREGVAAMVREEQIKDRYRFR